MNAVRDVPELAQRSLYQDCVDCIVVLKSPLVILRFLSWMALVWSASDIDCLIIPSIDEKLGDVDSSLSFLIYSVERLLPHTLLQLLLKFDRLFPQDNILAGQIALLLQKDKELMQLALEVENPEVVELVRNILQHSIKLIQRQTGK